MVSHRPFYVAFMISLFACGESTSMKDDLVKAPSSNNCVNSESPKASETQESAFTCNDPACRDYGPVPKLTHEYPPEADGPRN
jgi:hypothetical protein